MENGTTYIVRPRMDPFRSPFRVLRISAGSHQLLVGPASSFSSEQMKVRSSTRATSEGFRTTQEAVGSKVRVQPDERAGIHQELAKAIVLGQRAIAPGDGVRCSEGRHFIHPANHGVVRWYVAWEPCNSGAGGGHYVSSHAFGKRLAPGARKR